MRRGAAAVRAALLGMHKHADLTTPLLPHQQRVVDRLKQEDQPGLVVAHGLGSGKTLSSIAAMDALGLPTTVIVPAALQENFAKEVAKHTQGAPDYDLATLQKVTRDPAFARSVDPGLLIVDEAHRARDAASKGNEALANIPAAKRMLLTASPTYNHPVDLAALVNLAAHDRVLPEDKALFEQQYVGSKVIKPNLFARIFRGVKPGEVPVLKNTSDLQRKLHKWVDYHENVPAKEDFPERRDVAYEVPMSSRQQEVYDYVLGDAPAWLQYKIRMGLPPSKAEAKNLNTYLTGQRQAQLSTLPYKKHLSAEQALEDSTKQRAAFLNFQKALQANPNHKAVVYSNYLQAGLEPYRQMLEHEHIPYGMFTGELEKKTRDQMIRDYNEGKIRALLLSSAGGEGLDLKGTRQIQILEPHFNDEKLKQVIGRGIRYKSHADLPEDQRKVDVEQYLSTVRPGFLKRTLGIGKTDMSADQYLRMMSTNKEALNEQLRAILRAQEQAAIAAAQPERGTP